MLLDESFPAVRHVFLVHILRLQVLKLLTAIKMQIKVLLICRHFQPAGIRFNYLCILKPFFKIINQHIIQHTRLPILMLDIQVITIYLVIEYSFRDIHFR